MRSWTRTGAASCSNRIRRVSKTAMVADRFCVSRRIFPFIQRVFADSGYAGEKVTTATLIAVESCARNPIRSASPSTLGAGSSSGFSHGSGEIEAMGMVPTSSTWPVIR